MKGTASVIRVLTALMQDFSDDKRLFIISDFAANRKIKKKNSSQRKLGLLLYMRKSIL